MTYHKATRTVVRPIRLTRAEDRRLKAAAKKKGLTVSDLVRLRLAAELGRRPAA